MWDSEKELNVLKGAIATYGEDAQENMVFEEVGELLQALVKRRRNWAGLAELENLAEEIADVEICLDQLKIMHGIRSLVSEKRLQKIERLASLVKGVRP